MVEFTVLSQFQLGANPIGASHQDWFAHAGWQAAEAAKTAQPPNTSGLRVASTLLRIRSTKALPASTSTPALR